MRDHFKVKMNGADLSFLSESMVIRNENGTGAFFSTQVVSADPVAWGLIYRAIGNILDGLQPGIVSPLPDGDPNEFDAIRVAYEIDRLWREGNTE